MNHVPDGAGGDDAADAGGDENGDDLGKVMIIRAVCQAWNDLRAPGLMKCKVPPLHSLFLKSKVCSGTFR